MPSSIRWLPSTLMAWMVPLPPRSGPAGVAAERAAAVPVRVGAAAGRTGGGAGLAARWGAGGAARS